MSEPAGERSVPAAEAIDDFADLYPRQTGLNRYSVLSLSERGFRAYECNISSFDCECMDKRFNRDEGEICKHLAAALWSAPKHVDVEKVMLSQLVQTAESLDHAAERLTQRATAIESRESVSADADDDADDSDHERDAWDGDPEEAFRKLLIKNSLDPADFDFWIDDEYGSLQADADAYLDDGDFETWVEFKDELQMGYDQDSGCNYLSPDRFAEAFDDVE